MAVVLAEQVATSPLMEALSLLMVEAAELVLVVVPVLVVVLSLLLEEL